MLKIIPHKTPRSLLRNALILILALMLVVATQMARFGARAEQGPSREQRNEYEEAMQAEDEVGAVVELFHENVNKKFNGKIKELVEIGKTGDEADLKRLLLLVTPPALKQEPAADGKGFFTVRSPCVDQNLSTYCLALDLTEEYFKFRKGLMSARDRARLKAATRFETLSQGAAPGRGPTFEQKSIFGGIGDVGAATQSIQSYGEVINQVERELQIARQSIDQGLATYNELQMSLPLHMKYKKVIIALEKYRDKLADIRRQVDWYPVSFFNVTTPACT